MSWRNDLEIIGHHAIGGPIEDGDQISKSRRDDLIRRGYLRRDEDGTRATDAGLATWRRWFWVYTAWLFAKRLQWRWRERSAPKPLLA